VEAQNTNGDFYTTDRLLSVVRANRHRGAQELVSAIQTSVVSFAANRELQDDLTLMVLKVRSPV
jgi:serine phosphatase RsbU (regulator of sigma subunit)